MRWDWKALRLRRLEIEERLSNADWGCALKSNYAERYLPTKMHHQFPSVMRCINGYYIRRWQDTFNTHQISMAKSPRDHRRLDLKRDHVGTGCLVGAWWSLGNLGGQIGEKVSELCWQTIEQIMIPIGHSYKPCVPPIRCKRWHQKGIRKKGEKMLRTRNLCSWETASRLLKTHTMTITTKLFPKMATHRSKQSTQKIPSSKLI